MANTFAGVVRIDGEGTTKSVGKSEVTEFLCTHEYSYKEDCTVPLTLSFWGNRGSAAAKILHPGDMAFVHGTMSFNSGRTGKMFLTLQVNDFKKTSSKPKSVKTEVEEEEMDPALSEQIPF